MTTSATGDPMDPAELARFLGSAGIPPAGPLDVSLISGGRSNLTYGVTDGATRWVVRRPPTSGLTPSAHDMVREWTVTNALQGSDVPVPRTVVLCQDESVVGAPFTVVEFVDGLVVRTRDELTGLGQDQLEPIVSSLVDTLVALHCVDVGSVGLQDFGRPSGFVDRQIKLWLRQWGQVATQQLPDVETLHARLVEHRPPEGASSIVHGDFRIDNTILDRAQPSMVRAVVDWELSTIGDPLTDAALMCVYRDPALDVILDLPAAWTSPALPSADDIAQQYAVRSGRDLRAWPFYLALAYFKLAVIAEGIAYRASTGSDSGGGAAAARATPELISIGLRLLGR